MGQPGRPRQFQDSCTLSVLVEKSQAQALEKIREELAVPPLCVPPRMTDLIRLVIDRGIESVRAEIAALRVPSGDVGAKQEAAE